jgi:hypothetical protein
MSIRITGVEAVLKFNRIAALSVMVAALISSTAVLAQTAEPSATVEANATAEAGDAKLLVLDAFHALLTDSYHYESKSQVVITYSDGAGKSESIATVTAADGVVAPKGDNDITLASANGATVEAAQSGPHAQMERIVLDGVTYVSVSDNLKKQVPQITADAGWYRLDDLLAKLDAPALKQGVQSLAEIALPSKLAVPDSVITDVAEDGGETVDGVETRVFDVQIDSLALMMQQATASPLERLETLYKNRRLYSAGTFVYTARVWIDMATGRALKLHVESRVALPYVSVARQFGLSGLPAYDVDMTLVSDVTLSQWGEPVEIKAPTLASD